MLLDAQLRYFIVTIWRAKPLADHAARATAHWFKVTRHWLTSPMGVFNFVRYTLLTKIIIYYLNTLRHTIKPYDLELI